MKRLFYLVPAVLLALTLLAGSGSAQNQPRKRRELLVMLMNDVNRAVANATLTADQKKTLDQSREALRQAAMKRKGGERADPQQVRAALENMRSLFQSDAFRAEDRQAVEEDLRNIREFRKGARRRAAL